jgi:hypothetical protein
MSKFVGRSFTAGAVDGYDHGLLSGLLDDDHPQYIITSAIRSVVSPTSGITKTGLGAGSVFSLINAGTGAALLIQQTGTTTGAAVDIVNTGNLGTGLSVLSDTANPTSPLVQFSTSVTTFDEPLLSLVHADLRGLALSVTGDAYVSGQIDGPEAITLTNVSSNPISLGSTGIYIEGTPGTFFFVDELGNKQTFGANLIEGSNINIADVDGYKEISVDIQSLAGPGLIVVPGPLENTLAVDIDAYQVFYDDSTNVLIFGDDVQEAIDAIDGYLQSITSVTGGRSRHIRKFGSGATNTPTNTIFDLDGYSYTPGQDELLVFINGIAQFDPVDYIESSQTTITFTSSIVNDDVVDIVILPDAFSGGSSTALDIIAGCGINVTDATPTTKRISVDLQNIAGSGLIVQSKGDGCNELVVDIDAYQVGYDDSSNTVIFADNVQDAITEIDGYLQSVVTGNAVHIRKFGSNAENSPTNTVFELNGNEYPIGQDRLLVFVNGIAQFDPTDYIESSTTTITFTSSIVNDDIVDIVILPGVFGSVAAVGPIDAYQVSYDDSSNILIFASNVQDALDEIDGYLQNIGAGGKIIHVRKFGSDADDAPLNTVFSLDGNTYPLGQDRLLVWFNGISQFTPADYTERSTDSIETGTSRNADDVIDIVILPGSLGGGNGGTTNLQNAYDNSASGAKNISLDDGQITFTQTISTGSALRLITSNALSVTPSIVVDQLGMSEGARIRSTDEAVSTLLLQKDAASRNTVLNSTIIERTTSSILGGLTGIGSSILTRLENTGAVIFDASRIVTGTEDAIDSAEDTFLSIELSNSGTLFDHTRFSSDGNIGVGTTSPAEFRVQVSGDVGPDADNLFDLGSPTKRWKDGYFGPGSVHIGSGALSVNSENLFFSYGDESYNLLYPLKGGLDAYASSATLGNLENQVTDIQDSLDGYLSGATLGDLENQVTDVQNSLDGYALQLEENQRWSDSSQQRQDIRDALDGYLSDAILDGYASQLVENQRWTDSSQQRQSIRDSLDGYALQSIENQRWTDSVQQRQDIRNSLDGYLSGTTLDSLESQVTDVQNSLDGYASQLVENQRWADSVQQRQDIRNSLDGYALQSVESQRWADSSQQRQNIRDALDGYLSSAALDSLENQVTDVQNSLDGYALDVVEDQRWSDSSQQRQNIRDALDGYGSLSAAEGADGYLAFFTGIDAIAGDNDLFWDRANNRLGIHNSLPNEVLTVSSVISLAETSAPSESAGFGKIYAHPSDGYLHFVNSSGQDIQMSGASAGGGGAPPEATLAEATADTTTASGSDVLTNSMTITPASGTYLVTFTGSVDHSSNNSTINASIYSGGVQSASSERSFARGGSQGNVTTPFCCTAKVTVNGSEAIEGRWRTSAATATMHERTLSILKVT